MAQKYKVTSQKRLVDLNGNSVNFNLNFSVQSDNGEPFEVLVVDQATLDSEQSLEYKKAVDGKINGNVIADKNIYQNYFLILRTEKDCEVTLHIDKKELPLKEQYTQPVFPVENNNQYHNQQPVQLQQTMEPEKPASNFKFYMIILVVVIGLGVLYYFYSKRNNTGSVGELTSSTPTSVSVHTTPNISPEPISCVVTPASSVSSPKSSSMGDFNPLLERLNGLRI